VMMANKVESAMEEIEEDELKGKRDKRNAE
jgi:hypothetical protein